LFDTQEAVERIAAAREAANSTRIEFTITARTNVFLTGIEAPFAAAVRRANFYREAGADCVFVPGVNDLATIGALAREIDAPLGIAVGGRSFGFDLADLNSAGVKRVSLGGYLARASMAHIRRAAKEMLEDGTFELAVDHLGNGMLSLPFYSPGRIAPPSMWR
jgi:2-methylisocitrate lyase-like PEP mutase family enzyme